MTCKDDGKTMLRLDGLLFDTMIPLADPKQFCGRDLIQYRAGNAHLSAPVSHPYANITDTPPIAYFNAQTKMGEVARENVPHCDQPLKDYYVQWSAWMENSCQGRTPLYENKSTKPAMFCYGKNGRS